jgi:transposase-like protein
MRGGQAHDLILSPEHTQDERPAKYRCKACGEGYQVRTSAPSCRISLLEQMQQLEAP